MRKRIVFLILLFAFFLIGLSVPMSVSAVGDISLVYAEIVNVDNILNALTQDHTFGEFLLSFWAFPAIVAMLLAWIVLALANRRLRAWVLPTFAVIVIVVNAITLGLFCFGVGCNS